MTVLNSLFAKVPLARVAPAWEIPTAKPTDTALLGRVSKPAGRNDESTSGRDLVSGRSGSRAAALPAKTAEAPQTRPMRASPGGAKDDGT